MSLYRHTLTLEVRDLDPVYIQSHPKAALWEPYTAPVVQPPIVDTLNPLQLRRALRTAGLRDSFETAANADPETKDQWEYSVEFSKNAPVLTKLATATGTTKETMDSLFNAAAVQAQASSSSLPTAKSIK